MIYSPTMWRVVGLMMCLVACGATPPAVPPVPSQGGPAWLELESEHFTVWTDSTPEQGRALVRTMERLRNVVHGVSFFEQSSKARSFVIAFRNLEEVHAYLPRQFIAHAWSARNPLAQPVMVLATSSLDDANHIVTHELTHVIAFNVIPDQPRWFAEGIAGYFETVRVDGAKIEVGRPLDHRFAQIRRGGLVPVAQLFACDAAECADDRFYATSWALVTYLINTQPDALLRYMQRLVETPRAQQAALWPEVFPSLPLATLDRDLKRWLANGRIQINHYNGTFTDTPPVERPLTDADALAARGLVRILSTRGGVPDEVTQALALDPTAVLPNVIAATASRSIDADKARAIAAAHPDDWRAWWLVGMSGGDTRDALTRMCALLEQRPAALPPQLCAPAALDPSKDPRNLVFREALPRINACLAKFRTKPAADAAMEIDIADSGAVRSARATIGSPEVNACLEDVLRSLTFPAGYPGPYRFGGR